jgi:undecaprenyl-diphosphatase
LVADWLKVIVLGIVEGITEFLPVSSTGHLIVAKDLLNFEAVPPDLFEIFIQVGAVVAVLVYYAPQLWRDVRSLPSDSRSQQFWLAVIIAAVPALAVGFFFNDVITELLFKPAVVALALITGGILFLIAERFYQFPVNAPEPDERVTVSLRQALIIGLCQLLALIPGMSRSGMSILGGMAAGLNRRTATAFSFYLAIPVLGGATVYSLLKSLADLNSQSLMFLLVGAIVSGIVAWMSIAWLLRYVAQHTFIPFGVYRIAAGVVILALILAGIL